MDPIKLFSRYQLGTTELKNRIVMAPMTRSRAVDHNVPNELMATYYGQRAGAGLIITEGTSPSPNGIGYARIPGIYSYEQVEKWKLVTSAVHKQGAAIFVQLMHTGRVSHPLNMPEGTKVLAPSSVKLSGQMYTDQLGMQDYPVPQEMTSDDIQDTLKEFIAAAQNAIAAGFDGIELHAANGYLLEQFLNPAANKRTDKYGGSIENRCRFALEVAAEAVAAIGWDRVGIRVSPYGANGDMGAFPEVEEQYTYLAEQLNKIGIAYIHVVDHSIMGAPQVPSSVKEKMGAMFNGTLILSGGYDVNRAEADLQAEKGDLIAFGRPFVSNPDLPYRLENNISLNNDLKGELLYTPGPEGYTDYPVAEKANA